SARISLAATHAVPSLPPGPSHFKVAPIERPSTANTMSVLAQDASIDDTRVTDYFPLVPPQILQMEHPLTGQAQKTIQATRRAIAGILGDQDDRLLVIVGPCSIHNPSEALEYGHMLKYMSDHLRDDLVIVMRAYFEKPRTTVGWKGLINDPYIDGSFQINKGLSIARSLLISLNDIGVPTASELLDTISPQFIGDLLSWGAIGARTTECQLHRELASGVSFPVGFKNSTDGNIDIAVDAIKCSANPHRFLGVTKQGLAAITSTKGNSQCHVILRGSKHGPNYSEQDISETRTKLEQQACRAKVMVDCSHGNSCKDHRNQSKVVSSLAAQIAAGETSIFGVMIESNINAGSQKITWPPQGPQSLAYGVSITDACIDWSETVTALESLAKAVRARRELQQV
ncbi:Phe-inhibited DAHP synthase AroG, partial [Polychytrium aggregatum]|uniref:Phe-inhibited DAHP synthase AroG n=1 Tax=Polychytrium aggregatum TaxID=110093 RepID=UPI0022FDE365